MMALTANQVSIEERMQSVALILAIMPYFTKYPDTTYKRVRQADTAGSV